MKKKAFVSLALGCALLFAACSAPGGGSSDSAPESSAPSSAADAAGSGAESVYHKITAEEAKKMMDAGGVTVVDVRRADEYAASHIPGAILVPNESIGSEAPEALPDKDAVLLIHCRTADRLPTSSRRWATPGCRLAL